MPESNSRLIKRYANRKLYDTRESRYVTLQQVAALVREGEEVRIVDNTTKEDLTHVTLAQIIYEEERKAGDPGERPSVGALKGFIQRGGEKIITSLREGPVGKLVPVRREDGVEAAPAERRSVLDQSKQAIDDLQRLADERVRGVVTAAMSHVQQLQGEVRRLSQRVEELESRLTSLGKRKRSESEPPGRSDRPSAPPDPERSGRE